MFVIQTYYDLFINEISFWLHWFTLQFDKHRPTKMHIFAFIKKKKWISKIISYYKSIRQKNQNEKILVEV